ncbi:hypothetical protein BDA99DRAFT_493971 [Phascolomyces articulosus]|uniref:Uncharacterized protein n=1 Tax=Phascolomyces articulosus TaxID=60185 RepID=A0AAD5KAS8_9FUNG|nr:hypothetical protein BDA99DRAFT_493971 [Phascolomyces articulosus]
MTTKNMDKLATLCTQVQSITFQWDINAADFYNHEVNTRKFMTPVPFFQHFHPSSLKSLKLEANTETRSTMDDIYNLENTIVPVLQHLPNIERLELLYSSLLLNVNDIEVIHTACTKLKKLEIRHAFLSDDELLQYYHRQEEQKADDLIESSYKKQLDAIMPTTRLHSLSLPSFIWCLGGGIWLAYITKKYPELESLDISCNEFYHKTPYFYKARSSKLTAWRDHFPRLVRLIMSRFSGISSTEWSHLFKGIKDVILVDDGTANFEQWSSTKATMDIKQLGLSIIPKSIHVIHRLKHLRLLYMGVKFRLKYYYQELPIDVLLSSCPVLEHIKAVNVIISYNNNSNDDSNDDNDNVTDQPTEDKKPATVKSSLNKLQLHNVTLTNPDVLTDIGEHCPQLKIMELLSCTWLVDYEEDAEGKKYPVIKIKMPNQRFTSLTMYNTRIGSNRLVAATGTLLNISNIIVYDSQQPRNRVRRPNGQNDYLLLKLSSQENLDNHKKLYMTSYYSVKRKHNMDDMIAWLEEVGEEDASYKTTSDLNVLNDRIQDDDEKLRHWSTIFCCNHIDRFYFGEIYVDLKKKKILVLIAQTIVLFINF